MLAGAFFALALTCSTQLVLAQEESYALVNGKLFNGVDNKIFEDVTIFVDDGKIDHVSDADEPIPPDYIVVDLENNFLLPGLIDVHTHIDTLDRAARALMSGVTTVRTASVPAFQDVALRELVRSGAIAGPDVVAAGLYVTPNLGETVPADPRLSAIEGLVDTDDEFKAGGRYQRRSRRRRHQDARHGKSRVTRYRSEKAGLHGATAPSNS